MLQAAYMCSKYLPDKTKLRDTVMQAINSKDDKCSFTSFMTKIFTKYARRVLVSDRTKLDENAIADIRSIKSPEDYTKKLEVSWLVCCHSFLMVSMSNTVKTVVILLIAAAAFVSFQLATFFGLNGLFPNTTVSVILLGYGLGHKIVDTSHFRYE